MDVPIELGARVERIVRPREEGARKDGREVFVGPVVDRVREDDFVEVQRERLEREHVCEFLGVGYEARWGLEWERVVHGWGGAV